MSPSIRTLLTSFMIAAVAPVGMAVLDLEQPAMAKNGGGNGHGGGNGGSHGNSGTHGNSDSHGNAKGHANSTDSASDTDTVANAKSPKPGKSELGDEDSLSPSALGKLNGVLHASPNAIAHANVNSPIGTARAFGEALADFLDSAAPEDTTGDETDATAEDDTDPVTTDDLGAMMAKMTNKPVTAEQVEAVADKLGIETADEETTDPTSEDQASEDPTSEDPTGDESPKLDPETAQEIADKANEIHGFNDETADGQDGDSEDDGHTADSGGDTTDETVTN